MVKINVYEDAILCEGHAQTTAICGLFSGLCVSIANGIEMAEGVDTICRIGDGAFYIDTSLIKTYTGRFLVKSFLKNVNKLIEQYSDSFQIVQAGTT